MSLADIYYSDVISSFFFLMQGGKFPLSVAAYQGHGYLVELLIKKYKADIEAANEVKPVTLPPNNVMYSSSSERVSMRVSTINLILLKR